MSNKEPYPGYEPRDMQGAKCAFCNQTAIGVAVRFTIYVKDNDKPIPFRDPQKHEIPVCEKHNKAGTLLDRAGTIAANQRLANPTPPAKGITDLNKVVWIMPAALESITPGVLVYRPQISTDEIKEALATPADKVALLDEDELKAIHRRARGCFAMVALGVLIMGAASLAFGIIFSHGIALAAGIVSLTIWPIVVLVRFIELGRPPKQHSAQQVAELFYREVLVPERLEADNSLLPFQVLSPTVAHRAEANSVDSLQQAWNHFAARKSERLKEASGGSVGWTESNKLPSVIVKPLGESTMDVTCETWHFPKKGASDSITGETRGWVITRFHNVAVHIGEQWFLMAGEPGDISEGDTPPARHPKDSIWAVSATELGSIATPRTPEEIERQKELDLVHQAEQTRVALATQIRRIASLFYIMTAIFSCIFLFLLTGFFFTSDSPDAQMGYASALPFCGIPLVLYAVSGWAIANRKPWARKFALGVGIASLIAFPLGTIRGAYMIVYPMCNFQTVTKSSRSSGARPRSRLMKTHSVCASTLRIRRF